MKLQLASIVMATYNGAKFISEQIDSIIAQDYVNKELIIIDDGSNDETVSIINEYIKQYSWMVFIQHKVNLGLVKTFEEGIKISSGEYIFLCDQDDIWLSNKITRMIHLVGDSLLIHSDAKLIDQNRLILCDSYVNTYKDESLETFKDYLLTNNVTGCCAMITRKLIDLALPIPDNFYVHDHYFALVASYYGSIKLIDDKLVLYRQHGKNSMGAAKSGFDIFLQSSSDIANSYDMILSKKFDKYDEEIKLIRDYRRSICSGHWKSQYPILKLLGFNSGWKRIIYFYLITGFGSKYIAQKIYEKLYKQ